MIQLPTPFQAKSAKRQQSIMATACSSCCSCCCIVTLITTSVLTARHFLNLSQTAQYQPNYQHVDVEEERLEDLVPSAKSTASIKPVLFGLLGGLICISSILIGWFFGYLGKLIRLDSGVVFCFVAAMVWVGCYLIAYTRQGKSKLRALMIGLCALGMFCVMMFVEAYVWINFR